MNVLYLHGFGSKFDNYSKKIQQLLKLGAVDGFDIDYCLGEKLVIEQSIANIANRDLDLLIGTSMGGWLASKLSEILSIPFVAFNPVISPAVTLQPYIGEHKDFYGRHFLLKENIVNEYEEISKDGCGLIFLDEGDELINPSESKQILNQCYSVTSYTGGSHRFEHIPESIADIRKFVNQVCFIWGLSTE